MRAKLLLGYLAFVFSAGMAAPGFADGNEATRWLRDTPSEWRGVPPSPQPPWPYLGTPRPGGFLTGGPLMEPEQQTIQELREIRRQLERPADQRQHEVRIAAAAGAGAVAAIVAIVYWRRRRQATVTNARRTS
jgi:hypothetical protein